VRRDSTPFVADANQRAAILLAQFKPDGGAARRVFRCVAEKVGLNLLQPRRITNHVQRLVADVDDEPGVAFGHEGAKRLDRGTGRVPHIHQLGAKGNPSSRDPRHVEQVVEQPRHVICLPRDHLAGLVARFVAPRGIVEHPGRAENRRERIP
jgi:hypothetical protein